MMGETPKDVLGPLYMEIDAGNAAAGQFFTPPDLSELMARMIGPAPDEEPDFKTISDPACGAGSMLLAAAAAVLARGQNPRRKMFAEGIDIDRTCAFMCFVQLSLWGIPAIVWHGNALTGKFQKGWATPIYYLDGWHPIMRARRLLASIHLSEQPEKAAAACKGPTKPEPKSLIDLMIAP
jgi:type I restriction-modification system DNA methylase subunit